MCTFTIGPRDFLLNGEPFRVLSGAINYFRVHPDQWADRIHKARLMGLNTVETYVPWNLHAPTPGEWLLDGGRDLDRFLGLIAAEGMHAIVRPGPFICAEWDNGGLPGWLFSDPEVGVRRSEPRYLAAVEDYLRRVYRVVAPQQIDRGGPVILVQIENEYGAYGDDADYLRRLTEITRDAGIVVPLTTVDQPEDDMLANGSLPELHRTASFGSRSPERLATLRRHQPTGPSMVSEYWVGWFDYWGSGHHTTSAAAAADDLDQLLATGASVNIYMFHGGTNFGLTNGANDKGTYEPTVTSYDYDAPLDEAGHPTAKFWAFREVIARYAPVPDEVPPVAAPAAQPVGSFTRFAEVLPVAEQLGAWTEHVEPPTMDALGRFTGLVAYRVDVPASAAPTVLELVEIRDRGYVYADDRFLGVLARELHDRTIQLPAGTRTVTVLVEDQGRVNYGPRIGEAKGIIGPVTLDGAPLAGWQSLPITLEPIERVATILAEVAMTTSPPPLPSGAARWAAGEFTLAEAGDLFLQTASWGKGLAWINGFCLGRFWSNGPQSTLYVPAPVVQAGRNQVLVLDLEPTAAPVIGFSASHELGVRG